MHILYLDTDCQEQARLCSALSQENHAFQFVLAASPIEFTSSLRNPRLDLVLSDCQTPGLDGMQVLEQVKTQSPGVPVVLLDAKASVEAAVRAMKQGAADYLPKTAQSIPGLAGTIKVAILQSRCQLAKSSAGDELLVKTLDLERSNRSLHMLYRVTGALSASPLSRHLLENALADIRRVIDFEQASIHGAGDSTVPATALASLGSDAVAATPGDAGAVLLIPLRDQAQILGTLKISLAPGRNIDAWEQQLLDTVAYHFGTALLAAQRQEETRRIAALEERASIARELHDSLAQSLWYARIQMARLAKASSAATSLEPAQREKLETVVMELHSGLDDAHRQLRQLLSSFRAPDADRSQP